MILFNCAGTPCPGKLLSVMVKEFLRSVRIWQSYGKNKVAPFSGHGVDIISENVKSVKKIQGM